MRVPDKTERHGEQLRWNDHDWDYEAENVNDIYTERYKVAIWSYVRVTQ